MLKNWKVRSQLNLIFITAIAFVFFTIMIMLNIVIRGSYINQEAQILESIGKQVGDNIDNRLEYYISYLKLLSNDRQLPYYLANDSYYMADMRLRNLAAEFLTLNRGKVESIQLHLRGQSVYDGDGIDLDGIFNRFKIGGNAYQDNYYIALSCLNRRNEKVFSIFSKLYQPNLDKEYLVELRVYESELYSFFFIHADNTRISVLHEDMLMSTNIRPVFRHALHEQKRRQAYGVPYETLPEMGYSIKIPLRIQSGIAVVVDTDINHLERGYRDMFFRLAPLILIIILIAIVFVRMFSGRIQQRLKRLQSQISALSGGNLQYNPHIEGRDEFGYLARELDAMRLQIISLIGETNKANKLLRVAEMSALRAQINSHFLFNSLSSIKWLSKRNDIPMLNQAVDCLTAFLRYSLSLDENQVPLAEEIEQLNAYIFLQRLRYENDVVFHIDIDEKLLSCKTVKLVLQPLFENAIYHGRRQDGAPLHITLYSECDLDIYRLIIEDDGNGMSQDRIHEIYNGVFEEAHGIGYGLRNVMTRIKICSEDKGSVQIESTPGAFTKVTVSQQRNAA